VHFIVTETYELELIEKLKNLGFMHLKDFDLFVIKKENLANELKVMIYSREARRLARNLTSSKMEIRKYYKDMFDGAPQHIKTLVEEALASQKNRLAAEEPQAKDLLVEAELPSTDLSTASSGDSTSVIETTPIQPVLTNSVSEGLETNQSTPSQEEVERL
jgi:hypothetical protein